MRTFKKSTNSCPALPQHVIPKFKENDLFYQPAEVVAKTIVGVLADQSVVGKAYYIEGGDSWEIEDTIWSSQPQWLGKFPCLSPCRACLSLLNTY